MPGTVAVLGGGVAGLSAAHELVERGFAVTVYESSARFGGKARSYGAPRIGHRRARRPAGRARVPLLPGLLPPPARHDEAHPRPPGRPPRLRRARGRRPDDARARERRQRARSRPRTRRPRSTTSPPSRSFMFTVCTQLGISAEDQAVLRRPAAGAADELRRAPLRAVGEAVVVGVRRRREPIAGLSAASWPTASRACSSRRRRRRSARAPAATSCCSWSSTSRARAATPTACSTGRRARCGSIPWVAHLRGAGVDLRTDSEVDGIDCAHGRIAGVTVDHHGTRQTVTADHYVAAMPVEQLRPLLSPALVRAEPRLKGTRRLRTRWMNGVMFYLHHDVPILAGHTIYSDSDWALTSISQRQFWPRTDFARLGDGTRRRASSRSTCPTGSARRDARARWPRSAAPTRSRPRCGRSSRTTSTTRGTSSSTTPTSRAPSSTRTSPSPTRARRRTPSRCSSTPPARGPIAPRR